MNHPAVMMYTKQSYNPKEYAGMTREIRERTEKPYGMCIYCHRLFHECVCITDIDHVKILTKEYGAIPLRAYVENILEAIVKHSDGKTIYMFQFPGVFVLPDRFTRIIYGLIMETPTGKEIKERSDKIEVEMCQEESGFVFSIVVSDNASAQE